MTHRIVIIPSRDNNNSPRYNSRGALYNVTYQGEVIVTDSTEPCLEACRSLKVRGITGRLEMWDTALPYVRLTADIGTAAKTTIREGDEPPRLVKYVPFAPRLARDGNWAPRGVPVAQTVKSVEIFVRVFDPFL